MKNIMNPVYSIITNDIEKIINILMTKYENIKIDYIDYDTDSAIYYFIENKLYLINCDSIENTWYLSQIDNHSFKLLKEIYSASYNEFIDFLQK